VFCFEKAKDVGDEYINLFGCAAGYSLLDTWESQFTFAN
jgi:hypothetical protein